MSLVYPPHTAGRLQVYQLLAGRDFARRPQAPEGGAVPAPRPPVHMFAAQMGNYVYAVVDTDSRTALLVDPCWDVEGCFAALARRGVRVGACAFTHHHFDHVGGVVPRQMTGGAGPIRVPGLAEAVQRLDSEAGRGGGVEGAGARAVAVVGGGDLTKIQSQCGVASDQLRGVADGELVWSTGSVHVHAWSTPGHTPGSICLLCTDAASAETAAGARASAAEAAVVITGDTLFIGACGRYDLPDSNPRDMLLSLDRLSTLPESTVVCPGHNYAVTASSSIAQEKASNGVMRQAIQLAPRIRQEAVAAAAVQKNATFASVAPHMRLGRGAAVGAVVPIREYLEAARHALAVWVEENGGSAEGCSRHCGLTENGFAACM